MTLLSKALMLAAFLTASAFAAVPEDACKLVTQAQVSAAIGAAVDAGTHVTPTFLKTCTWATSAGSGSAIKYVTLHVQSADSYDAGKKIMQMQAMQAKAGEASVTAVSGVGDDAYFLTLGTVTTSINGKKGATAFKVEIYGNVAAGKKHAMEKALAVEVVSKL
jgi:hypothetical protein